MAVSVVSVGLKGRRRLASSFLAGMVGLRKDCSREASGRSPCRGVCKGLLHVGKAEDATNEIREKEGVENG